MANDQNQAMGALSGQLETQSKLPLAGATDEELQGLRDAQQQALESLQHRYDNPNWFNVAAGFAKPQLGGFTASLGSAAQAMGENVEQQRSQQLPIATMRAQIAQTNYLLGRNKSATNIIEKYKLEHPGEPVPPEIIAQSESQLPGNASAAAAAKARQSATEAANTINSAIHAAQASGQDIDPTLVKSALKNSAKLGNIPYAEPPDSGAPTIPPVNTTNIPTVPTANGDVIQPKHISKVESNNTPGAIGPNVPGQGTAKSEMQVMDKTADNPGYGVTPAHLTGDKANDESERARVGKDYFNALTNKFGSSTLGAMAYNWGPGKVQTWMDNGADPKAVPKDVRDYVANAHISAATDVPQGASKTTSTQSQGGYYPTSIPIPVYAGQSTERQRILSENYKANSASIEAPLATKIATLAPIMTGADYSNYDNAYKTAIDLIQKHPEMAQHVFGLLRDSPFLTALQEGFGVHAGSFNANVSLPAEAYQRAGLPENEQAYADVLFSNLGKASMAELQQRGFVMKQGTQSEFMAALNQYANSNTKPIAAARMLLEGKAALDKNKEWYDTVVEERATKAHPDSATKTADVVRSSQALKNIDAKYGNINKQIREHFSEAVKGKNNG
jgi:hypothetical protein